MPLIARPQIPIVTRIYYLSLSLSLSVDNHSRRCCYCVFVLSAQVDPQMRCKSADREFFGNLIQLTETAKLRNAALLSGHTQHHTMAHSSRLGLCEAYFRPATARSGGRQSVGQAGSDEGSI